MLTDALETVLFASALMWPITIPVFLVLLGCFVYMVVYMVKNWKKRSVRIAAGVLGGLVLLLTAAFARESAPYSPGEAKRLYERHRPAYDTVAAFLLERAETEKARTSYWVSDREEWPVEIAEELDEVLTIWSLHCGSPNVSTHDLNGGDCAAVLFHIYSGPEYDSGDGGSAYDSQYLAYAPEGSHLHISNSYLERLTHLTGDWYLYRIVNV